MTDLAIRPESSRAGEQERDRIREGSDDELNKLKNIIAVNRKA